MSRWQLSGFADEIDPNLTVQLDTLVELGISGIDLRSVGGVNVLDLQPHELFKLNDEVLARGLHVQSIGSPLNKIPYDILAKGNEFDRLNRALKAAELLNVKRVRIFTPEVPREEMDSMAGKVIEWMNEQRQRAEELDIVLLIENDAKYWSAYPDNAKRLFDTLGSEHFKAAFDFANTVLLGFRPMRDWFPWLLPHLDTLHIKDAIESENRIVPAGQGEGEIEETLSWLQEQGWSGPLTLEPHLQSAGAFGGVSGGGLFRVASEALRGICSQAGIEL